MNDKAYTISAFGRKPAFSSFLPGVAGERGIPLWCFYVNRGQCIAGFGARDKNHSIMEFSPANTAYQRVPFTGFRTFIKSDDRFTEPFADGLGDMHIGENSLTISWENREAGWRMEVDSFIVPNTPLGMLARRVKISNISGRVQQVELLDGLAAIVPFGLSQHDLKMMGQTAKAWMMVEGLENDLPYFRLRTSLADTTSVQPIEDGSFGAASALGTLLSPIVDPALVFGWDTSFARPEGFLSQPLELLLQQKQRTENELPCCFFGYSGTIADGETLVIESVFGLSHGLTAFHPFVHDVLGRLSEKLEDAKQLLDPWVLPIHTQTADPLFDRYCRQSYIDNLLRGGAPRLFRHDDKSRLFYLFSRKHGDLERDYNDFVVTPEYASQGNGNFRDVLQNRRSDVRFCPEAGWEALKPFCELIQPDGYNPLVIQPVTYVLRDTAPFESRVSPKVLSLLKSPFTPGALMMEMDGGQDDALLSEILCAAESEVNAAFGEGYWVDHWIYLLDMLESFLSIYPEKENQTLFTRCLRWRMPHASVLPLEKRCVHTKSGWRQHRALEECAADRTWLEDQNGQHVASTLFEKLFMLCVIKFLTLDPSGEAISMEAGKPGWYDALNGLPGLFGSSTCECFELWRTVHFACNALKEADEDLRLPAEMLQLARDAACIAAESDPFLRWQRATKVLESYRASISGCCGVSVALSRDEAAAIASAIETCVSRAAGDLISRSKGAVPTYFTNLPADPQFTSFEHRALPLFLEGPMHALRLPIEGSCKEAIIRSIRQSVLYDEKLQMYKVSSDLTGETPELGRANAFTRGWLEHESIWLHMEYKYLLEMLKNGFYEDFFRDFETALIPFQPAERYGRSVLENSSFLASSANPDPSIHGRGFVARLSGATAEFLEMWQILFFGKQPFRTCNDGISLTLVPTLPSRLIGKGGSVSAMFLGQTPVTYLLPAQENITPVTHKPISYQLVDKTGVCTLIESEALPDETARLIRDGQYSSITVRIGRR